MSDIPSNTAVPDLSDDDDDDDEAVEISVVDLSPAVVEAMAAAERMITEAAKALEIERERMRIGTSPKHRAAR